MYLYLIIACIWLIFVPVLGFSAPLFDDKTEYPVGPGPIDIFADDFDGDGYIDLALTNYTYSSSVDLSVLLNRGDGTFVEYEYYSTGRNYMRTMTAADLDNDGDIDLAMARSGTTNNVITMLNDGGGVFQLSQTYDAGDNALSICAYDVNNDNWTDLAVAYEGTNEVAVLLNNGDSTFTDTTHYACGTWATSITGGDFNKDSAVDLVVTNAITAYDTGRLSLYINKGDGLFMDSVNYPSGWQPYSVIAGDFDDDDNLDLAVADGDYDGCVLVLMGSDSAVFQDPVYYDVGHSARDVCTADLDNNGSLDLIAGVAADSTIVVLLNNGDGTFTQEGVYQIGSYVYSVCCADFDHDGDIDIAAGGHTHNEAVLLFNQTDPQTDVTEDYDGNIHSDIFDLYQNHPNPFNPITVIKFSLPTASKVRLDIYNILGQKIETLVDTHLRAGVHSYKWNASEYPSGIYFTRLKAGSFTAAKKMILLK